ncbi:Mono-/di-acylglycerol lipase [Forsythia ovata]|uniref:Mono-/di-acylglycerol lipase n=1 Tax=Forsythia ovata TaxID=205694 RepID=A0ABD1UZX6_9LAMI
MAASTMATVAGAVVLLYYVLSRRLSSAGEEKDSGGCDFSKSKSRSVKKRLVRRPAQAPATWLETISTLSETLRFTYSETLGKWPIGDLAFGINYLIRRLGALQVASVYGGENCVQLKGPEIIDQLYHYLRLLTLCMLFSKKTFQVFLESAGYSDVDVLLQKPKAGLLKPAFTILRDENSKCFLLLIRGTHSIKDTLTAATGAVVPFHHSVLHDGGISNLILGYAHCGMVAAARWIAKLSTPSLLKALEQNPDYKVKIVGHSLGGGTAALLTYILREHTELSASTCVTFAPAACMTWELAESGKHFVTTIVNGSDLVPTFSAASVDDLRSEVVMKRAQDVAQAVVRTRSSISSWTCMGPRRRAVSHLSNFKADVLTEASLLTERTSESLVSEVISSNSEGNKAEFCFSTSESGQYETDEEEDLIRVDEVAAASTIVEITEGELWYELEKELQRQEDQTDIQIQEEEEAAIKETSEEEKVLSDTVESQTPVFSSDVSDNHHFYPPGRIMHIVSIHLPVATGHGGPTGEQVCLYETPRELYSKLRLSKTMINDHYMPMYKKMMELLTKQLENDLDCSYVVA